MSHKINKELDKVYLAEIPELFNGLGWHKLGTPTKTFNEKTVAPVLFSHGYSDAGIILPDGKFYPTGERYAVALDNNLPIGGAIGERYHTPSNAELYKLFTEALAGSDYDICSCGTVDSRVEFFVDAKSKTQKVAGRDYSPFVGLHRQFGGKTSIVVCGHGTVIQCGNTTALFLRETGKDDERISAKNTTNVMDKLPEIKKAIEAQHGVQKLFVKAMEASAKVAVSPEQARQAFVGFEVTGKLNTRSVNRVNRLLDLFATGPGNTGKNGSDWFNAVTDYYTHENAGSLDTRLNADEQAKFLAKQWYSSERGSGSIVKTELASRLFTKGEFQTDYFTGLQKTGAGIIKASEKELVASLN